MSYCTAIFLTVVLFSVLLIPGSDAQVCNSNQCPPCYTAITRCTERCEGCDNTRALFAERNQIIGPRGVAVGSLLVPINRLLNGLVPDGNDTNDHINTTVFGFCRFCEILTFNTTETGGRVVVVDDGEIVGCRENAEGFLCSQCSEGFYHNKGLECVPCDNLARDWFLYLGSQLVSITVMFFLFYFTNFSIVIGGMNAAIFFAQMVTTTMDLTGNGFIPLANVTDGDSDLAFGLTAVYQFIYGPWNLDFFTPFVNKVCLFHKESYLYYFAVEYLLAFYPLVLVSIVTIMFLLWDHLHPKFRACFYYSIGRHIDIDWKMSTKNILASFFILSYTKFAFISISAATPNPIFDVNFKPVEIVAYLDATVQLYSGDYLGIFIVAICAFIFLGVLPIFLFLLCRFKIGLRNTRCICIDVILEPYQKPFKHRCDKDDCKRCNSNEPRKRSLWKLSIRLHDYRWIPAIYFSMRLTLLLISSLSPSYEIQFIFQQVVCIIGASIILFFQPYEDNWFNKVEALMLLLLAFINTLSLYQYYLTIAGDSLSPIAFAFQYILIFVPALYMASQILYNLYNKLRLKCCHTNKITLFKELEEDEDVVDKSNFQSQSIHLSTEIPATRKRFQNVEEVIEEEDVLGSGSRGSYNSYKTFK